MRLGHTLLGALVLVALAQPARSEDVARTWHGPYVGIHGGYSWATFSNSEDKNDKADLRGAIGGGHIGHLWQWQSVVAGIEGDFSLSGSRFHEAYPDSDVTIKSNWLASLRGRVGIDAGPALLYATAGIAWTDWSYKGWLTDFRGNPGRLTGGAPATGWVFGGGVETQLTRSVVARIEGLHYRFDRMSPEIKIGGTRVPELDNRVDQSITVVRGGLSWRF